MQKKCISKIIKLALPDNLKNQRFKKAICHRENIGIRSTYAFIALPDTNLKNASTSELVMRTFNKPIY